VTGGLYRYVRNPMYLAVVAAITGQALGLGQPVLLGYAAAIWITTAAFARWYEEPALTRQFGAQYQAYRRGVPAWRATNPAMEAEARQTAMVPAAHPVCGIARACRWPAPGPVVFPVLAAKPSRVVSPAERATADTNHDRTTIQKRHVRPLADSGWRADKADIVRQAVTRAATARDIPGRRLPVCCRAGAALVLLGVLRAETVRSTHQPVLICAFHAGSRRIGIGRRTPGLAALARSRLGVRISRSPGCRGQDGRCPGSRRPARACLSRKSRRAGVCCLRA